MKDYYVPVFDLVRLIPKGKVTTYGHIAKYLGLASPRMVGYALRHIPLGESIPAHRVVASNGELTGRNNFCVGSTMEERMRQESIPIKNKRVTHFADHLWDPARELF